MLSLCICVSEFEDTGKTEGQEPSQYLPPNFYLTYAYTNKEDFCATKQVGRNPLANPQSDFLAVFKLIFYQFFTIILPPRFDTTSKITAARRTTPFTTFCMLASTPISDIPRLITPIRTAPTITPGTVPIPP